MKTFTGWQYLLIDVANNFGLDKKLFEERIQWAEQNLNQLEDLLDQAETKPLYLKAVQAVRKAQQRIPSGHLVAMDATCSGVQIMSALTGCIKGATATGLVDPNRRADAYSDLNQTMNGLLGNGFSIPRGDSKQALMTSCYGSKKVPKVIFGEDTPELAAFYQAVEMIAPGAWELLQDLLDSWQPYALAHEWKLPDGFDAKVKVMEMQETRIEVDELDHATFTYQYAVNEGSERGRANVANVIHSVDAFILRELIRRCDYEGINTMQLHDWLQAEMFDRAFNGATMQTQQSEEVWYYTQQWERSGMPSAVILPYLTPGSIMGLPQGLLAALKHMLNDMVQYDPFPVITIHDSFAAHANNVNHVRHWYKEILAELADSDLLSDLLSQIHGTPGTYPKLSQDLSKYIRQSNYALS